MTVPLQHWTGHDLELWGGVECTVNRVGDSYHDQLRWSGHDVRLCDLDRIASLGLKRVRYPVLWERHDRDGAIDWGWSDARLTALRELGIEPIVGLLHHGSGPRHAGLLDDSFVPRFVAFARQVAERYHWVRAYALVNEPLTTARFAALYGHWHPHRRDDRSFSKALVQQLQATVLAAAAIRQLHPDAVLLQTEDLGTVSSTPQLQYQSEFENIRRWLTWDLLFGRVTRDHFMWTYLQTIGVREQDLDWFVEHRSPPDILGINHYITSDRFLDHRTHMYPPHTAGGNHLERYADVESVRVVSPPPTDLPTLLHQAWARYATPLVVAEAHMGCTREEQLRWLLEVWIAARRARDAGVAVAAVTSWALLGTFNWNSLVTVDGGHYEAGAFDLRPGQPQATALAAMVHALSHHRTFSHPTLSAAGWWRRDARLLYRPLPSPTGSADADGPGATPCGAVTEPTPVLLVVGTGGKFSTAVTRACRARALPYHLLVCDDAGAVRRCVDLAVERVRPWAIVDTTSCLDRTDGDRQPNDAAAASRQGIPLLCLDVAAEPTPDSISDGRGGNVDAPLPPDILMQHVDHALDVLIDRTAGAAAWDRRCEREECPCRGSARVADASEVPAAIMPPAVRLTAYSSMAPSAIIAAR